MVGTFIIKVKIVWLLNEFQLFIMRIIPILYNVK